jgi:hypothetical protein
VLAGRTVAGHRLSWLVPLLAVLETRLVSPARDLPGHTDGRLDPAFATIATSSGDAAVMNYPIVGGRPYLYEQTAHRHPVAGTLNFPNNAASKRVWQALLDRAGAPCAELRGALARTARIEGIGFLVVHADEVAEVDVYRAPLRRLLGECAGLDPDARVVVYPFDPG